MADPVGQPLRPARYTNLWQRAVVAAGVRPIRLHDARHTAITLLLAAGVPVHDVAAYAGHDVVQTLSVYAHSSRDALGAAGVVLGAAYLPG